MKSPEERSRPGYGWWSDNPDHVDCPDCIGSMPALLKRRWEVADGEARRARQHAETLYAQADAAARKAGVTF